MSEGALLWEVSKQRLCFSLNSSSIYPGTSQLREEPTLGWKRLRLMVLLKSITWTLGMRLHRQTHRSPGNRSDLAHSKHCSPYTTCVSSHQLRMLPFQRNSSRSSTCWHHCTSLYPDTTVIPLGGYDTWSTSLVGCILILSSVNFKPPHMQK